MPFEQVERVIDSATKSSKGGDKNVGVLFIVVERKGLTLYLVLVRSKGQGVLIDAQFTRSEATKIADAIESQGVVLKAVYVTHGHPDHAFGLEILKKRFPNARVLAHPEVAEHYVAEAQGKLAQWKPVYGDDLTDMIVPLQPFAEFELKVGNETLEFVSVGQGDTESSVVVRVKSSNTIVAGDVVYDGVHPWLAETDAEGRKAWLQTLQTLRNLKPSRLIPGHQKLGSEPAQVEDALSFMETYLTRFDELREVSKSAEELEKSMLKEHAKLALPVILQFSARAAYAN